MTRVEVRTDAAPSPSGTYSQGIVAGGFLYTAGMGPSDPATGEPAGTGIEEQTARTLRNLRAVLAERGLGLEHVVKATVHLADVARDFAGFDRTYQTFFAPPYPVRTTVGSTLSGILVEIDLVAAVPEA